MIVQELVEELTAYITESGREKDVAAATVDYYRDSGALFGDEENYDMRVANFLEWYIFDRTVGGKTLLEEFFEGIEDGERKKLFEDLGRGVRTVFELRKADEKMVHLRDLRDGKRYSTIPTCGVEGLSKGDIIDARLFCLKNQYYLSGSYIFHPPNMKKFITSLIKEADGRQDLNSALRMLANMSLKWERFRNYHVEDIYTVKEN